MPQRKETKKIKVRDLKPKKDAKGGSHLVFGQRQQSAGHQVTGPSHGVTGPTGQK